MLEAVDSSVTIQSIAAQYHAGVAKYDLANMTGVGRRGEPVPADSDEKRLSNQNASKLLREATAKATSHGFTKGDLTHAIKSLKP